MAQSQAQTDDALLGKMDLLSSLDEELGEDLVNESLDEIRSKLSDNRDEAEHMSLGVENEVSDVLDPENVDMIEVRAKPFENPKVTVWLHDCPVWANDGWSDTIYPRGLNAFNAKTRVVFDVREF